MSVHIQQSRPTVLPSRKIEDFTSIFDQATSEFKAETLQARLEVENPLILRHMLNPIDWRRRELNYQLTNYNDDVLSWQLANALMYATLELCGELPRIQQKVYDQVIAAIDTCVFSPSRRRRKIH